MVAADRFFDPDPSIRSVALDLYALIMDLPIVSPHGHVDPGLFSDPTKRFGNPVELLVHPDHYIMRMMFSQGIPYEKLLTKKNPRKVWQLFADNFYLYRGTPSGLWFNHLLDQIFDIDEKLDTESAQYIYDRIEEVLADPGFTPRNMFEKMRIEVLATTDPVTDSLDHHQAILKSGWSGRIIPTFRADDIINLQFQNWLINILDLSIISGIEITDFNSYIEAIKHQRRIFKSLGATATDTSVYLPTTSSLAKNEVESIFQNALKGLVTEQEATQFHSHMLLEMARMSVEDGLVMQLHPGIYRNHNPMVQSLFGSDMGFDIPVRSEYTLNLKPLLDQFGNHPNFTLIVFTLDETAYARELAPLAGAYPALKLGPPWWFYDSWNGMRRYFDQVMETAGLYNTVGFNDDTRSFLAIPARHDVWRRAVANWLAGLQVRHLIDRKDAEEMAVALAVGLARQAYRL